MPPTDPHATKTGILDAAERLFADRGIAATSLRAVTSAAGVNLAAVHYHFGSKDGLVQAVFSRRLEAVNGERLRLLDACEEAGGGAPTIEDVLHAFVVPVLRMGLTLESGDVAKRLFGRLHVEPSQVIERVMSEQFGAVARRFIPAIVRAVPDVPEEEVLWRIHFAIGAMAQTCLDTHRLQMISGGRCDPSDVDGAIERLVRFLAAGLSAAAPAAQPADGGRQ